MRVSSPSHGETVDNVIYTSTNPSSSDTLASACVLLSLFSSLHVYTYHTKIVCRAVLRIFKTGNKFIWGLLNYHEYDKKNTPILQNVGKYSLPIQLRLFKCIDTPNYIFNNFLTMHYQLLHLIAILCVLR
jgi:hypothetical protein